VWPSRSGGLRTGYRVGAGATWAPFARAWGLKGALSCSAVKLLVSWILFSVIAGWLELQPETRARPATNGVKTMANERHDIGKSSSGGLNEKSPPSARRFRAEGQDRGTNVSGRSRTRATQNDLILSKSFYCELVPARGEGENGSWRKFLKGRTLPGSTGCAGQIGDRGRPRNEIEPC
jgi:hypothetical protein